MKRSLALITAGWFFWIIQTGAPGRPAVVTNSPIFREADDCSQARAVLDDTLSTTPRHAQPIPQQSAVILTTCLHAR